MGRTPIIGSVIKNELEWEHILTYCEAILRVYNLYGRRDNMYKARIKILVKSLGIEAFKNLVEDEWKYIKNGPNTQYRRVEPIKKYFSEPIIKKILKIILKIISLIKHLISGYLDLPILTKRKDIVLLPFL